MERKRIEGEVRASVDHLWMTRVRRDGERRKSEREREVGEEGRGKEKLAEKRKVEVEECEGGACYINTLQVVDV